MPIEEEAGPRKKVVAKPPSEQEARQAPLQWTPERRQAHAERMREVMARPDIRERLREANTGRVVSDETREKIRQSLLKRYHPEQDGDEAA